MQDSSSTDSSTSHGNISTSNSSPISHPQECSATYLQHACPLCFGGLNMDAGNTSVDLIVCLDANFQLKRNWDRDQRQEYKGQARSLDPEVTLPRTIFLSESQIWVWEERVEAIRPSRPKSGDKQMAKEMETTEANLMDRGRATEIEPGMNLPNATYDACRDSFIAADSDWIKASLTFFDSTGVMAMLCHHDCPLLLANLKTAGEKQFYPFTLISALMNSLPGHWRVGILYDIGCQLHHTLQKWDFMPQFFHRLVFAVSIFHAYGHQWACQLWYHPQKAELWGLSDGEGCERFWSKLRKLIPGLRVTGVRYMTSREGRFHYGPQIQRFRMGYGLLRRLRAVGKSFSDAKEKLAESTFSIKYLLHQFKEQHAYHSKPIMWQSKTQGARAIEHILSLQSMLEAQQENLWELISKGNDVIPEDSAGEAVLVEWQERVHSTKLAISQLQSNIKKKTEGLKLGDRVAARKLEQLKKDRWITMQLNLHILREQLVQKLHACKFELATLDHAHSTWILHQKTKVHVEKAVHHHLSRIDAMMKKYNAKIKEMAEYRQTSRTISKSAYIPPLLLKEGLYKMDVDQDIWEDARADVGDFPDSVLPQWLVDASVKKGIFMAQEVVNCEQELERCKVESSNL
ncbi:hypothetical protein BS47DRAFT_1301625 [Hydnum rufescens UP504]|uniref:Uncharacterized protein n=1 Tax=Hydnum rufescens UP504 TaxID=1448309 RepID=A0A9P6APM4_9AGAM|nr:hypothetical protein BS47DRAFT_1301625 [Hydnum rufescens UP504]